MYIQKQVRKLWVLEKINKRHDSLRRHGKKQKEENGQKEMQKGSKRDNRKLVNKHSIQKLTRE